MLGVSFVKNLSPFIQQQDQIFLTKNAFFFLGVGRWLLAGLIFAVLLAVLLYQLFAPGSELRYYRCRQGSIEGSEMWFTFTTSDKQVSIASWFLFRNSTDFLKLYESN